MAKKNNDFPGFDGKEIEFEEFQAAVMTLVAAGVTPEAYKELYDSINASSGGMLDMLHSGGDTSLWMYAS